MTENETETCEQCGNTASYVISDLITKKSHIFCAECLRKYVESESFL